MRHPSGNRRSGFAKAIAAIWHDRRRRRSGLLQGLVIAAVVVFGVWLGLNLDRNLSARGIAFSFRFLRERASFDIGEAIVAYSPTDAYQRAIWVGALNSLRVAAAGILLATVVGTIVGVASLSSNWLARALARAYVEILRNTPLLLQLLFWYFVAFVRGDTLALPGRVFLTPDGTLVPGLQPIALGSAVAGLVAAVLLLAWRRHSPKTVGLTAIGAIGAAVAIASWQPQLIFDLPRLDPEAGRAVGGLRLSPEFSALLAGLTFYTAAFIAEIVRAGLESVPRGQWEAARALGLKPCLVLRLVVFPQALRAIVPPLTGEYLNLWKNSSLAAVVGYPDLYFVASTTFNQTGRAVEVMLLLGLAYLSVSLAIAGAANSVNRAIARYG